MNYLNMQKMPAILWMHSSCHHFTGCVGSKHASRTEFHLLPYLAALCKIVMLNQIVQGFRYKKYFFSTLIWHFINVITQNQLCFRERTNPDSNIFTDSLLSIKGYMQTRNSKKYLYRTNNPYFACVSLWNSISFH